MKRIDFGTGRRHQDRRDTNLYVTVVAVSTIALMIYAILTAADVITFILL